MGGLRHPRTRKRVHAERHPVGSGPFRAFLFRQLLNFVEAAHVEVRFKQRFVTFIVQTNILLSHLRLGDYPSP